MKFDLNQVHSLKPNNSFIIFQIDGAKGDKGKDGKDGEKTNSLIRQIVNILFLARLSRKHRVIWPARTERREGFSWATW